MDGELLAWLYRRLLHDPNLAHRRDCTYGDGIILLVYFYATLNNRSVLWASKLKHWPCWCAAVFRDHWPSRSQINKRLQNESVAKWIATLDAELRERLPRGKDKVADGKPLVVGGFSHDPDARWGKTPGQYGWAKGYKLHSLSDAVSAAFDAWEVTPLDAGEATVLRGDLIPSCDLRGCTLRADANYDSNPTYRAVALAGGRHIAPRRKPGTGLGHRPHHPDRLRAVSELEQGPDAPMRLRAHKRARNRVEQTLAHLTNLPFGLWALPNHVRRLHRVRLWVAAKILLYHLHLTQTQALKAAA
jgi:Transposase DDE domain